MSNVLQNYTVMLYLRHICHILFPKWQIRFSISWVTNKPQEKHHWMIVKHICHFASQMILYLGPLLQCGCTKFIISISKWKLTVRTKCTQKSWSSFLKKYLKLGLRTITFLLLYGQCTVLESASNNRFYGTHILILEFSSKSNQLVTLGRAKNGFSNSTHYLLFTKHIFRFVLMEWSCCLTI
jgi:hypothetical protein